MEIILIRHGKPTAAVNPKLTAVGFTKWVKNYNQAYVAEHSRPPVNLKAQIIQHYLVSSDLKRAIQSAEICTGQIPQLQLKLLREMDIPRYKLPFFLKAYTWLILNRFLWMLGLNGKMESFEDAKERVEEVTEQLIDIAFRHDKIVVFGHGYTNRYIRIALQKRGWVIQTKDNKFWGTTRCTKL